MADRAQRFTSRTDAESARPQLRMDNPVPLEKFADLVGDYRFPKREWIRCQLVDQEGACRKLHGWGWIAQLTDESEGYIGHDCAESHFKEDPRFAAMFEAAAVRVDREITTDLVVSRLGKLLSRPDLREVLNGAMRLRERLYDRVTRLRALLPNRVWKKLENRAKSRDTSVSVRVFYVEIETEIDPETNKTRERKVTKPKYFQWGNLGSLSALDDRPLLNIGKRLAAAEAVLLKAVAGVDQPITAMRKWVSDLEYVDRAPGELSKHQVLIENFCRPENLKLLWLLATDRHEQISVANAALEIASHRRASDDEATAARDAWAQEIKDAHGGRSFEVVG